MRPFDRLGMALRVLVAVLFLVSLGGAGGTWLPSSGLLLAVLILLLLIEPLLSDPGGTEFRRALSAVHARWFEITLLALALSGLGIRLIGAGHGLGHEPTDVDERRFARSVVHFFRSGTIDHSTVEHYPGVHFWLLSASSLLTYVWALMSGVAGSFRQMPFEWFVWAGRATSACLEAGTIIVTGLLGRAVGGRAAAIVAAGIMAASPLSLQVGSLLRNDPALVLLVASAVCVVLVYSEAATKTWALVAGMLAGCAAAVKYSGAFALAPVLLSCALGRDRSRLARAGMAALGFGAALAVTNHYLWADLPNLLEQLSFQIAITGKGHWSATSNPRWFYATTLANAVGWPLFIVAIGFAAAGLAAGRRQLWLLMAFPITYAWFMTQRPAQFSRWVYPMLPFVAVAASTGLFALEKAAKSMTSGRPGGGERVGRLIGYGILAGGLVPFLWAASAPVSWRFAAPPYALAEAWLRQHVARGEQVLSEDGYLDLSGSPARVVRVSLLSEVLAGGDYQLQANDWIVVPEVRFGDPNLGRLSLARDFSASWRIGGNAGSNFRIYVPGPVRPLESRQVVLDEPEAFAVLGLEWRRDGSGQPGLALPQAGASLFLPSLAAGTRIEVEVVVPDRAGERREAPVRLLVLDHSAALERVPDAGRSARFLSVPIPRDGSQARVTRLRLEPLSETLPVRVVRIAWRDPAEPRTR